MISLGRYDEPTSSQVYLSDLAPVELAAVGSLLADDLGPLDERRIVDDQSPALARHQILGLMERDGGEMAKRTGRAALVARSQCLGSILHDDQFMIGGDRIDPIHVAGGARIMHNEDRLGAWRDSGFDRCRVDVERTGIDVDEYRNCPAKHHRVGGRHEGERRHDHLVARPQIAKDRRHFQRSGAGMGKQRAIRSQPPLEPFAATARKVAIARELAAGQRRPDVLDLAAQYGWPVERYHSPKRSDDRPTKTYALVGMPWTAYTNQRFIDQPGAIGVSRSRPSIDATGARPRRRSATMSPFQAVCLVRLDPGPRIYWPQSR